MCKPAFQKAYVKATFIVIVIIIIIIITNYPLLFELRHILELLIVYFMVLPHIIIQMYPHSNYNALVLVLLTVTELWPYVADCFRSVVESFALAGCFVVLVGIWLPTSSDTMI